MAEVAGLVLGAIGIAGVIGAFKDAIDLFACFAQSRELGRDYEILNIKLDIEKALLLQWADRVGLLRPHDYDRRLDQEDIQATVVKILSCIRLLLSDASSIKEKYGFSEIDEQSLTSQTNPSLSISAWRMSNFNSQFESLKKRMAQHGRDTSVSKKVLWAIRDKQGFERLIIELAHFTAKLDQVTPIATGQPTSRAMADEDLKTITELKDLKLMAEASSGLHKALTDSARKNISRTCEKIILNQLWFRKIHQRKDDVGEAHKQTLDWALHPPRQKARWDNLADWLQNTPHGIYWISGKAGSGKSTLMKHLLSHPRTELLLDSWAGEESCVLVDHFFYNLGTPEQKQFEGLSRALLYQMLNHRPALIHKALPDMMKELKETDHGPTLPSLSEIRYAFRILAKDSSSEKYCIFLDGLDEFEGNINESIALIQELGSSPNIKVLVSSRPIPSCVAAYEDLPKLHLQDLTHSDIKAYVQDTIGGHRYMQRLLRRNKEEAEGVLKDIVSKSSGVFLWVVLACRSLLVGFGDCDRLPELRRRVDELPHELEDLFALMLTRIDGRHKKQGAYMLRLCFESQRASQEPGSDAFSFMSTLPLALIDDSEIPVNEIRNLTTEDKIDLCTVLEGRLRSRCGGLLETAKSSGGCYCGQAAHSSQRPGEGHNDLVDGRVAFMHRTVFEFLSNDDVWQYDCLQMDNDEQRIARDLCLRDLYMMTLGTIYLQTAHVAGRKNLDHQLFRLLTSGIFWMLKGDLSCRLVFFKALSFVLEELARCRTMLDSQLLQALVPTSHSQGSNSTRDCHSHTSLLIATHVGALDCAVVHPDFPSLNGEKLPPCGCPTLLCAEFMWPFKILKRKLPCATTLALLLKQGANPRLQLQATNPFTPWSFWLQQPEGLPSIDWSRSDEQDILEVINVAIVMLKHEAGGAKELRKWIKSNDGKEHSVAVEQAKAALLMILNGKP
ncbi:prion-inhibition and propagation-domain-containing protein [Stachybotrys elegans]|uniref:Prion-inhibition and propagation-domain-containing protein n=1 Tax=Stachybotrys elegans TaxID=80388 RepID=A0A8K0WQ45_9HYPO|nr:prion-inhibition and propagation-domain-containing protein [Stachybotrys elegans]